MADEADGLGEADRDPERDRGVYGIAVAAELVGLGRPPATGTTAPFSDPVRLHEPPPTEKTEHT